MHFFQVRFSFQTTFKLGYEGSIDIARTAVAAYDLVLDHSRPFLSSVMSYVCCFLFASLTIGWNYLFKSEGIFLLNSVGYGVL